MSREVIVHNLLVEAQMWEFAAEPIEAKVVTRSTLAHKNIFTKPHQVCSVESHLHFFNHALETVFTVHLHSLFFCGILREKI